MPLRILMVVAWVACWRGEPVEQPAVPVEIVEKKPSCLQFDADNPACRNRCTPDAPNDWQPCREERASLIANGHVCGAHPKTCRKPPVVSTCPACPPVYTRIIAIIVVGGTAEVTLGAGANQNLSTAWRASVIDGAGNPVPGGAITLTRVDRATSIGVVALSLAQLQQSSRVFVQP